MGLLVPEITLEENTIMSNVYIAVAHYDINIRNYTRPSMVIIDRQEVLTKQIGILKGMSILINYGVWISTESRTLNEEPVMMLTIQAPFNEGVSNIYEYTYGMLKSVYPNSIDAQETLPVSPVLSTPQSEEAPASHTEPSDTVDPIDSEHQTVPV